MNQNTIVLNLLGGPGAFKSTIAYGVFTLLKIHGITAEVAHEFAKELTWEEQYEVLKDQSYVFGNQYHRIWRLVDKVDVVICDSPLILSLVYPDVVTEEFTSYVLTKFNSFNNMNLFLNRNENSEYEIKGRSQNHFEACKLDAKIKNVLNNNNIHFIELNSSVEVISEISEFIITKLFNKTLQYKLEGTNYVTRDR